MQLRQPAAPPIVQALKSGIDLITPVKPDTIASSIAIGDPADGYYVVKAIRESGGWGESVTNDEILKGIRLRATTEGISTEPAGGTEVAVTKKLIEQGRTPRDESIVISITGNGYKTLEVLAKGVQPPICIDADIRKFHELYRELNNSGVEKVKAVQG